MAKRDKRRLHVLGIVVCAVWLFNAPNSVCAEAVLRPATAPQLFTASAALTLTDTRAIRLPSASSNVSLNLNRELTPADGAIAVLVAAQGLPAGKQDMTVHTSTSGTSINIDFTTWPLRDDINDLFIYQVELNGKWRLIASIELRIVATADGAAAIPAPAHAGVSPFSLRLDVGVAAQLMEEVSGSQRASLRPRYHDLNIQGGINTSHEGDDWEIKSQVQFVGGSYRQQMPTYSRLGENAPKLDISSYLIDSAWRDTRLSIGHISVDTHPLLISGVSNRGVAILQKLPLGFDFGFTAQNGEPVSGYRNLAGLSNNRNQFRSIGLGLDVLPDKPGFFRVDLNLVDASVQSGGLYGLPISEDTSRGTGARLLWRDATSRFRFEAIYAKSQFIAGNTPVNFSAIRQGQARTFEAGYDVLRDVAMTKSLPVSLNLGVRHEQSSPFYRSLGAGFQANYQLSVATISSKIGVVTAQLQFTNRFDNVDKNPLYMRNRVQASAFNLNLPISQFLADNLQINWAKKNVNAQGFSIATLLPTLSFSQQFVHGFGDNHVIPAGYTADDLPDVYVLNRSAGFQWQFERVSVGLRTNMANQKNRQRGFSEQSTWDKRYGSSVDWRITDKLTINLAYDPTYNYRYDVNSRNDARQLRGGINWTMSDQWQLSAELNHSADFDTLGTRYNRQNTSQMQLSRRFVLPVFGWKNLPGQFFFRYTESAAFNSTRGAVALEPSVKRLLFGLNLTVL